MRRPYQLRFIVAAILGLVAAVPAPALVLHPEDEGPPPVRPLDAAVGRWVNNASCVVIAPNYVLTTRHQGYGVGFPVVIGGNTYTIAEVFNHGAGEAGYADIRVVRIAQPDGQPANLSYYVPVYEGADERYRTAVIGGYGLGRGASLKNDLGVTYGYQWAAGANDTLRWGANRIDNTGSKSETYNSDILIADFDGPGVGPPSPHVPYEAAVANYDSGGGWFIDVSGGGGDWRLAGLTRSADPEHSGLSQSWFRRNTNGTPNPAPDPDYMDAVRVSTYAGWINGILGASAWAVDGDNVWSAAGNWAAGVPASRDKWAVFGGVISADRTITVDGAFDVGTLRFDDDNSYTLAGPGSLTLKASSGTVGIEVNREGLSGRNGAHTIAVPVAITAPLVINQRSAGALTISGRISGSASVVKTGPGVLVLGGPNDFSGGLTVREGTVRVTGPGALGAGTVTMSATSGGAGTTLDIRGDADLTLANNVTVAASTTFNVQPLAAGSGRVMTLGALSITGDRTLTFTGSGGYGLVFSGQTIVSGHATGPTFNTASAGATLAGGFSLSTGSATKTGSHTLTVSGPQTYGSGVTWYVDGGVLRLGSDAGSGGVCNLAVAVRAAGAAAEFASTQHLALLSVTDGSARVTDGPPKVVLTKVISIDICDSLLDLRANSLAVDYTGASPLSTVQELVRAGYNAPAGYWNGHGITSGAAAGDADRLTALGVADNIVLGRTTFGGQPVDATSVLVKYTYWGDADLDGEVDTNDYDIIDFSALFPPAPTNTGWWSGDFNYDGVIDTNDYDLIDYAFLFQGGPLADGVGAVPEALGCDVGSYVACAASAESGLVPEPGTLALLVAGLLVGARRSR